MAELNVDGRVSGWLGAAEAAEHTAAPVSRVYALVESGSLPHHRDGTRLLFRVEELDESIRAGGAKRL